MDKKQNLTPELKQIYDRVMNTPTTSQSSTNPAAPVSPSQIPSPTPAVGSPVGPTVFKPQSSNINVVKPTPVASSPTPHAPAANTFVFQANNAKSMSSTPTMASGSQSNGVAVAAVHKGGGLSPKLLAFIGIAFFIFYALFWLRIFGY